MLKVRSSKSDFMKHRSFNRINAQDSKALYDPYHQFDYFYKIIVIGDENVGKSNLLARITKNKYIEKPKTTYGVEYDSKVVPLPDSNQRVCSQIWDTSGAK